MLYALLLSLPKASEEIMAGSVVEVDFLDFGIQLALFRARTHGEIIGNKKHLRRKCGGRKLFALDKKKKKKKLDAKLRRVGAVDRLRGQVRLPR